MVKKLRTNSRRSAPNWPQRLESARVRCAASLRRTSKPSPTRCRSAMSSHPRINKWGSKDVDTFWTSYKIACCPMFSGVDGEQCFNHQNNRVWGRNASVEGRRVSRRQNPTSVMVWAAVTATGRTSLVFVTSGVKLNSQRYISDILEG